MRQREVSRRHPQEQPADQEADGGEARQVRIDADLGGGHPESLGKEAGEDDGEEQGVDDVVVAYGLQPFRLDREAPYQEPSQHHEGREAGQVQNQGEELVEGAFQEDDAQHRLREICLRHDEERADEEEAEGPEEDGVEQARVVHAQHPGLGQDVSHHPRRAPGELVETLQRLAQAVHREASVKAPGADRHGGHAEEVHREDDSVTQVPVNLSRVFHDVAPIAGSIFNYGIGVP